MNQFNKSSTVVGMQGILVHGGGGGGVTAVTGGGE